MPVTHIVDVIRPADLLQLRVEFRGVDIVRPDPSRPAFAQAVTDDTRMIVHFAFQHAHEQAVFEKAKTPTLEPDPKNPTAPTPTSPEPGALGAVAGFAPARASRVVFKIPRNDAVPLDIGGILTAMRRLAVAVAAAAAPEAPYTDPVGHGIPITLAGGLVAMTYADRVVIQKATVAQTRAFAQQDDVVSREARFAVLRQIAAKPVSLASTSKDFLDRLGEAGLEIGKPFRPKVVPLDPTRLNRYSSAPADDETAIEAPYRLVISPNAWARFAHALEPVEGAAGHVELWHTRLAYARSYDVVDEDAGDRRVIRALWARDREALSPSEWKKNDIDGQGEALGTPALADDLPFRGSLNRSDRHRLVRQTSEVWRVGGMPIEPLPVRADKLHLSALGGWLDLHGLWDTRGYSGLLAGQNKRTTRPLLSILRWDHIAPQGRDQFVRVMYPGYLYPFGHRATLVKITERKIRPASQPRASLFQRMFIVLSETTRTYRAHPDREGEPRDFPFTSVALHPIVTPDIDDPATTTRGPDSWFWPKVGGTEFVWDVATTDQASVAATTRGPLIWVNEAFSGAAELAALDTAYNASPLRVFDFGGQPIDFAPPTGGGDARVEAKRVLLRGEAQPGTSTPHMTSADVVLPAAKRLTGLDTVPIAYEEHYRQGTTDAAIGVWAALLTNELPASGGYADLRYGPGGPQFDARMPSVPALEFGPAPTVPGAPATETTKVGSDRGGGFLQPSLPLRALSTEKGPVGDLAQATSAAFNPKDALAGALPRLFGLVSLSDLIPDGLFESMPAVVTETIDAVTQLVADLEEIVQRIQEVRDAATAAARTAADTALTAVEDVQARVGRILGREVAPEDIPAELLSILAAFRAGRAALESALPEAKPILRNRLAALDAAIDTALGAADFVARLQEIIDLIPAPGKDLKFRFDWTPPLKNWPEADPILVFNDPRFVIAIEGRIPAAGAPQFEVLAELRDFLLDLLPGASLLKVPFEHISFRASSSGKTEVDVVLGELEFQGALSFINDIKDLIPLDGFSDPPFMEVSTEGIKAGFSLALPTLAIGVFSLSNISLGADVHVPFLGSIVSVGFNFCTREKPFVLSVCFLGGGGFFGLRISPDRVELVELSLEAGAYLSVDLGVASGSISAAIGVYIRMEGDDALISGFFRLRGEVDVLGLISASIELAMSLDYYPKTGKVIGRASITVEVEVLIFSGSVTIEAERQFAGSNGDPAFRDAYVLDDGTHALWDDYLDAFATEEVAQ